MSPSNAEFPKGTRIRLVNDPLRIGVTIDDNPIARGSRRLYKVQFPDIVERIPETELERVPDSRTDPLDLLEDGKLGTPDDLRRALIHKRMTGALADVIYSMEATNTTFYAYQFKPVTKILQTPANGLLIADEVGLGKTIEAGLIWTELRARFNYNRLLVVCPASLCEKWRDELDTKIGVAATICNVAQVHEVLRDQQSARRGFALIASMQGLRPRRSQDSESNTSDALAFYEFLERMKNAERLTDVLIIDEAHHMRNSETATHKIGHRLRSVSEYVVLLTATPVHNHNDDLFSLLKLIDPDMFAKNEYFTEILQANEPLIRARDCLLSEHPSHPQIASELDRATQNPLLEHSDQLITLLDQFKESDITELTTRLEFAYRLEMVNLLSHTITRTRKHEVLEGRVVREPISIPVSMTPTEERFYELVTEIVTEYALSRDMSESFLQVTPQQQMASCMPGALKSWQDKRLVRDQQRDHWSGDPNQDRIDLGPLESELVNRAAELFEYEELRDADSKYVKLKNILTDYFSKHPSAKIIVFSTFRATVAYLASRLSSDGMATIMLRGGAGTSKRDILKSFASPKGPQVLLSTEVGGEGLDLQFCRAIINYDLPWNPMRLEQRIGRIDRLGQLSDKVSIRNIFYDKTIESRIYRRLYEKLDLCRRALGDLEPILGKKIDELSRELLTCRLSPEEQEKRIDQTARAIEERRAVEARLEAEAANLVAYGDYILNEIHAARDLQRWIVGDDLRFYVTNCLNFCFPNYKLTALDAAKGEYMLLLPPKARHELREFIKTHRLFDQTSLHQSVTPIHCRFDNRSFGDSRDLRETVSQFHPLTRFAGHKLSQYTSQMRPAVAIKIPLSDVPDKFSAGLYLLAVSLWSIKGIRHRERLSYAVEKVTDPKSVYGNADGEALASACVTKGTYWIEVHSSCDLAHLHQIANENLFWDLEVRYKRFVANEKALNRDRAEILETNLRRRFSRQEGKLIQTLDGHRSAGSTSMIRPTEGRLEATRRRFDDRIEQIEQQREVTSRSHEIAIAIVNVE